MKENGLDRIYSHLRRFYKTEDEVVANPDATSAQIFNDLAHQKGKHKSHHQYEEDKLRPGGGGRYNFRKGRR